MAQRSPLERAYESVERLVKHKWLGPIPRASDPSVRMKPMNLLF